ncbi:MAG: TrbC family F-type conjugative pilus assembly protein [Trichlorobacter sp.]
MRRTILIILLASLTVPRLLWGDELTLCLSMSMPFEVLRRYVQDAARQPEPVQVAFRGFVGGARTIMPTLTRINQLLLIDVNCQEQGNTPCPRYPVNIRIDPVLFRAAAVQEVPTLVLSRTANGGPYRTKSGDARLSYLRETLTQSPGGLHDPNHAPPDDPTPIDRQLLPAPAADAAAPDRLPPLDRPPDPDHRPERVPGSPAGALSGSPH